MINRFDGDYAFLSNFYEFPVMFDGILYPTNEHAFQAAKTLDFEERKAIAALPTPGKAKRAGRRVSLREDWENVKDSIMKEICLVKFSNKELRDKLVQTKPHELIEGNTWNDRYWGVCNGTGENHLGKILMEIRDII